MRTRHAAAIGLRVIGAIFGLVALVAGATMLILGTPWGGERLRRQVVKRVNAQIQGRLDVARLSFGGDRVDLWGVTLRDPDGGVVADIAHVDVAFSVARLVRKQIRIVAVEIQTPHLTLISDAQGTNLARATAPRRETPPKPEKPRVRSDKEGWVIDLSRFELTNGDVSVRVSAADSAGSSPSRTTSTDVHLAALSSFITARYATGNGSLDATFRLNGESKTAPVGPLDLSADVRVRGDLYRGRLEGIMLGGTIRARGDVDRAHLESADALVAVAIPALGLAGHEWGPLRIDGDAHPGATPTLNVALAIPGVRLSGKSNDSGGPPAVAGAGNVFLFDGQLALADLALTARALQALGVASLPALAGNGHVDFGFGGSMSDAPSRWSAHAKAAVEHVRVAENVIDGVKLDARIARLSRTPGQAELNLSVASVQAGATALRGITLTAGVRERTFSTELAMLSPDPINLKVSGNLDDDGRGLALEHLALSYPGGEWTSEGIARVTSTDDRMSVANLRLRSAGQTINLDGAKAGDQLDAHLAVHDLRLSQLPVFLVDPKLRLAGVVDADITASGATGNPRVAARVQVQGAGVDLQHGRAPALSKIAANLRATLADHRVDGTVDVEAPFAAMTGSFGLPVDPTATTGAPVAVTVDVTRLDLGDVLRAGAVTTGVGGQAELHLRLTGTAGDPRVDFTAAGKDLRVSRPPAARATGAGTATAATPTATTLDVGHARVHLTYATRKAAADINFASAHGGSLRVDAAASVDLSYPRVTRGLVVKKLPVRGKVVARSLNVAWLAQVNPRVESLGGQVSADASLTGTLGDPQFVGDVRWKNGGIVAKVAPPAVSATNQPKPGL